MIVELDKDIDFKPANVAVEVMQNVRTILSTRKGSVPLDRDFGIDFTWIDQPISVARMRCQMAIIDAIEKYEPRAEIEQIEWSEKTEDVMDGKTMPKVSISVKEEFLNE